MRLLLSRAAVRFTSALNVVVRESIAPLVEQSSLLNEILEQVGWSIITCSTLFHLAMLSLWKKKVIYLSCNFSFLLLKNASVIIYTLGIKASTGQSAMSKKQIHHSYYESQIRATLYLECGRIVARKAQMYSSIAHYHHHLWRR